MLKKIVLGMLFIVLIGVLVAGAAIRTMDRSALVAEAEGNGRDLDETFEHAEGGSAQDSVGFVSRGETGGGVSERKYPNFDGSPPEELLMREGTVVLAPEDGVDLVIEMSDGKKLTVGTGPMYMTSQGFILQAGELVQVLGYWEDHEFKAAQVTCLTDGQTITLRDEIGRPAWAGAGRRAGGAYIIEIEVELEPAENSPPEGETENVDRKQDAMVVAGKTTFADLLDWGVPAEQVEAILGSEIPNRLMLVYDYCAENALSFGGIKAALQAEVDKL